MRSRELFALVLVALLAGCGGEKKAGGGAASKDTLVIAWQSSPTNLDGRVGNDTMVAVRAFQRKTGLVPADGYPGLKVLARLRQGG